MANNRATPNKLIMCIPLQKCLLDVRLDDIQSDLVFTALSYHDVGREAAGLNKLMIHRLHGCFVLLGDGFNASATLFNVSHHATHQTNVQWGINKDFYIV